VDTPITRSTVLEILGKVLWQGRLDFASGNYGPIKALEFRDLNNRLSNFTFSQHAKDPDPYPVVDPRQYLPLCTGVDRLAEPQRLRDNRKHNNTSILRLFLDCTTDVKTGEIRGTCTIWQVRLCDIVLLVRCILSGISDTVMAR